MRIAIYGATGYSGIEALRLLVHRPDVEVVWIGSETQAGKRLVDALPMFRDTRFASLTFSSHHQEVPDVDFALLATPHGVARSIAPELLAQGIKVIDFSGDFRLPDDIYEEWYGKKVDATPVSAVYGLPEINREAIKKANFIANPGCYATTASLALIPAVEAGIIAAGQIMIDAKSGVSGAGRSLQLSTHFVEADSSVKAYKVGAHQHTPEIEQTLETVRRRRSNETTAARVLMTTQLLPIKRGIYVTAYGRLEAAVSDREVYELYRVRFADEPFVKVLQPGEAPEIRQVTGNNECHVSVHVDQRTNTLLVMSTLDNLIKGAAGQALQNLNLMAGIAETTGLVGMAWW